MRLGYVITRADILGGAHVHVRDLALALQRRGHEVAVFAGRPGVLARQLDEIRVPYVEVAGLDRELSPLRDAGAFVRLRTALRDFGPDLVSTHCSKAGVLGRLAARTLRIPALFTAHGWSFSDGVPGFRRALYQRLERIAAPLAQRVVVVCDGDRRVAREAGIASAGKLRLVYNGMPDIDVAQRARPDEKPVRLIMIARVCEQKDYPTLFRALAELRDLDWHLDQVGDGPMQRAIQCLAAELGLSERISFLGLREDVVPLLARSHVYLLISNWEGFPRSILEAMRAGLPVIASDVGGVREAIADASTGFLVPRLDVRSVAERLRQLIESPSLRLALGREGRELYVRRFTFERMLEETMAVYGEIIDSA
jgi:glycosyltransferase involved in cell wall biosynthesis